MGLGVLLPFNLPRLSTHYLSNIPSFMFSNVPGLRKRLVYCGAEQTGIVVLIPNIGAVPNGLSFITTGDVVGAAIFSDEDAGI